MAYETKHALEDRAPVPPEYSSIDVKMENDIELAILTPEAIQQEISELEAVLPESVFQHERAVTIASRKEEDITTRLNYLRGRISEQQSEQQNDNANNAVQNPSVTPGCCSYARLRNCCFSTSQAHHQCRRSAKDMFLDYRSIFASLMTIAFFSLLIWCIATGKFTKLVFIPIS